MSIYITDRIYLERVLISSEFALTEHYMDQLPIDVLSLLVT